MPVNPSTQSQSHAQGAESVMICPKCGQKSDNFTTCSHCGIIFKKYAELEARKRELEYEARERRQQSNKKFLLMTAGIATFAVISLVILSFDGESEPLQPAAQTTERQRPLTAQEKAEEQIAILMSKGYTQWDSEGSHFVTANTPDHITQAKDSMFSIVRGQFGRGPLGFIVSRNCHAIIGTDLSQQGLKQDRASDLLVNNSGYQKRSRELEAAEKKFNELRIAFIQRCSDCSESAYDPALKRAKLRVETLKRTLQNTERYLENKRNTVNQQSEYQAKTPTGTYPARLIESNQKYNLSLVILDQANCNSVELGNPSLLQKNDPVYAYTRTTNNGWSHGNYLGDSAPPSSATQLTHNIKIFPGDIGTPLLNQSGEAVAIMVAPKGGTPQAIPIDTALRILRMPL
jgi:hypothetical protein